MKASQILWPQNIHMKEKVICFRTRVVESLSSRIPGIQIAEPFALLRRSLLEFLLATGIPPVTDGLQ